MLRLEALRSFVDLGSNQRDCNALLRVCLFSLKILKDSMYHKEISRDLRVSEVFGGL